MCGIVGIVGLDEATRERAVSAVLPTLAPRGPDASGSLGFARATLGHARLSIIDLSTGGQPMRDNQRDIAITFNGEIFNYKELRSHLAQKGHVFSTSSDTEVILKTYCEYGNRCPEYLDGQFAFAIWDDEADRLFMARDRFGEKPLYYSRDSSRLIFASEIKTILATELVSKTLDRTSLDNYLALYFVPPWRSVYRDIVPLPPAHRAVYQNGGLVVERYWSLPRDPSRQSYRDAIQLVREMLAQSARSRMVADVEVGVFLSGGVDSSIITALAQNHAVRPLKSFSAGFGSHIDELPYARDVAEHVGTDHHERSIPISIEDIRRTIRYFDEPFGDSSNVPTGLLSQFAQERVKVVLSGDGGDEIFFGYGHYRLHWHLPAVKQMVGRLIGYTPDARYRKYDLNLFAPQERKGLWRDSSAVEVDPTRHVDLSAAETPLQKINLLDIYLKLPGDMLAKVDRSSMMHSLEVRSPFLNHELAEAAFNLPDEYKTSREFGKIVLQDACGDVLPSSVFTRRKQGFGAPVEHWLQDPEMRRLVEEMFGSDARVSELIDMAKVRTYWEAFYGGAAGLCYKMWILFALELWLREHEGSYAL